MSKVSSQQMYFRVLKDGWYKRTYELVADEKVMSSLRYEKLSHTKAIGKIHDREFSIRRAGFWKHFVEINSSVSQYNHRFRISWRNTLRITDGSGNEFVFKPSGIWQTKWQWLDRHERPIIEMKSKTFSKMNRGLVQLLHDDINDPLFWVTVGWFIIICAESDAAVVVAS